MTCTKGSSPNHKLMRTTAKTHPIFCANVRERTCGVCTVPLALAAKPLGNISLQQPLQQIFKLCSEWVWQLHVLQGLKRGQTKGGGQRKDCLRTWRPWHLHWNKVLGSLLWGCFKKKVKQRTLRFFSFVCSVYVWHCAAQTETPLLSWDLRYYIIVYNTSVSTCNPILILYI